MLVTQSMFKRVPFDPTNKIHRSKVLEFLHNGAWGGCGCPFEEGDDFETIPGMVISKMLAYYMSKEFT